MGAHKPTALFLYTDLKKAVRPILLSIILEKKISKSRFSKLPRKIPRTRYLCLVWAINIIYEYTSIYSIYIYIGTYVCMEWSVVYVGDPLPLVSLRSSHTYISFIYLVVVPWIYNIYMEVSK